MTIPPPTISVKLNVVGPSATEFAFKGIIGVVSIIYIVLFGLSFWQISALNNKISDYDQIVQNHEFKKIEMEKFSRDLNKLKPVFTKFFLKLAR